MQGDVSYCSCFAVLSLRRRLNQNRCDHAHHLWRGNSVLSDHLRVLKVPGLEERNTNIIHTEQRWSNDKTIQGLHSQQLLEDLCKSASQSPESGGSEKKQWHEDVFYHLCALLSAAAEWNLRLSVISTKALSAETQIRFMSRLNVWTWFLPLTARDAHLLGDGRPELFVQLNNDPKADQDVLLTFNLRKRIRGNMKACFSAALVFRTMTGLLKAAPFLSFYLQEAKHDR